MIIVMMNVVVGTVVNGRRCGGTRNRNISLVVSATIYTLNLVLFIVVFFMGGGRHIPFARRGIDVGSSVGIIFNGGGLLVISLAGLYNFNENICNAISLCVTVCLLNSGSLGLTLLLPVNVNATINALLIGFILGGFSAGGAFVLFYVCNTSSLTVLCVISHSMNFGDTLIVPFLVVGFFYKVRRNGAGAAPGVVVTSYISRVRCGANGERSNVTCTNCNLFSGITSTFAGKLNP